MRQVDFGQVANSYARSREDIPATLMDSLFIRNIIFEGKKIADIGAGTGTLTRKIAMRKGNVIGVEPSLELRKQAMEWNVTKNFTIPYIDGTAEATGLKDSEYDIVTVMRAWHWFNREEAIREIKRILKTNGILIVIDSGFLPDSQAASKTLEILPKYIDGALKPAGSKADTKQRINGFPVEWFEEWRHNDFELREFYKLNYTVHFTRTEWVERIESISWLAGLDTEIRDKALEELLNAFPETEEFDVQHHCNVCILKNV